jgi:GDPmannose 4,6-dehydratase
MLQKDKPVDYVLATGETYTVKEFVTRAFAFKGYELTWVGSGLKERAMDQNGRVRVVIDEKYYRPCEVDLLLGDPTKAINELEWERHFDTLDKLIEDMFSE